MILSQLTTLLSLLTGAWLPTGSGRPGPRGLPAQPQAAANETQSLGQGAPAFPVPSSALGSWKVFLGLQKTGQLGTDRLQHGQDVAITLCARSHALGTCGSLVLGGQPSLPSPGEGCPLCGLRGVSADQRHELSITNGHTDARTLERRGKTG
eukprot:bmy_04856T0